MMQMAQSPILLVYMDLHLTGHLKGCFHLSLSLSLSPLQHEHMHVESVMSTDLKNIISKAH